MHDKHSPSLGAGGVEPRTSTKLFSGPKSVVCTALSSSWQTRSHALTASRILMSNNSLPSPAALQQLRGHFPLCHRQEGNVVPEDIWEAPYCLLVLPLPRFHYLSLKMQRQITAVTCLVFAWRLQHRQVLKVTSLMSMNVVLHKVVCSILNFTPNDVRLIYSP